MAGSGAGAGSLWNKNSWHWEEKKYTPWAHEWLKENLVGVSVESDGVSARITKVGSVTGDVRATHGGAHMAARVYRGVAPTLLLLRRLDSAWR